MTDDVMWSRACTVQANKPKYNIVHQKQIVIHDIVERASPAGLDQAPGTEVATARAGHEGRLQPALQAAETSSEGTPMAGSNMKHAQQPSRLGHLLQSVWRPFGRSQAFSPTGVRLELPLHSWHVCMLLMLHIADWLLGIVYLSAQTGGKLVSVMWCDMGGHL